MNSAQLKHSYARVLAFELKHQHLRVLPFKHKSGKSQRQRQRLDVRVLVFELKLQYLKILAFMDSNWSPHLKHST
jgi:hypothetical protein